MKIYLAGPLGFSEAGETFMYGTLIPKLEDAGFMVINPWKLTDEKVINNVLMLPYGMQRKQAWARANKHIGYNNEQGIKECDIVLAVLDGSDVDSGTAAEIGFAYAIGKRIVGYRSDFRMGGDNEGAIVNLQVEYFIRQSGGTILPTLAAIISELTKLLPVQA